MKTLSFSAFAEIKDHFTLSYTFSKSILKITPFNFSGVVHGSSHEGPPPYLACFFLASKLIESVEQHGPSGIDTCLVRSEKQNYFMELLLVFFFLHHWNNSCKLLIEVTKVERSLHNWGNSMARVLYDVQLMKGMKGS